MNLVELLIATRERIYDSKNWTGGELARDGNMDRCGVNNPYAVQWSLPGALLLEGLGLYPERVAAAELLREVCGTNSLSEWNLRHSHKEAVDVLTQAIGLAAERGERAVSTV